MAQESSSSYEIYPLVLFHVTDHATRYKARFYPPLLENNIQALGALMGTQEEHLLRIQCALNVPFDIEKLSPTDDTYAAINLYKNAFPNYSFLGWYYIGEKPNEQIKAILTSAEIDLTVLVILHFNMSLYSQISYKDLWNLYSIEDSEWKELVFHIHSPSESSSLCLNELALVSGEGPQGRLRKILEIVTKAMENLKWEMNHYRQTGDQERFLDVKEAIEKFKESCSHIPGEVEFELEDAQLVGLLAQATEAADLMNQLVDEVNHTFGRNKRKMSVTNVTMTSQ